MKEGHGGPMDEDLKRKVDRHDNDLYYGNGKPGLTTRMALSEKEIDTVKEQVEEIVKDGKATRKMLLALILTVIGEIIARLIVK